MKFWKKLRLVGSAIVIVLGLLALILALMQAPPTHRPASTAPANGLSAPQHGGTQGL